MAKIIVRLISGIMFVISIPLLFVLMIIIRIDSKGSPLFKQERVGKGGKKFILFKLRTMKIGCEAINIYSPSQLIIHENYRITKVGKVLRKFHLDEIPQFWNILKGEMAFVGPRPLPFRFTDGYYAPRNENVLPGLTGLLQIRKLEHFDRCRMKFDKFYCKNKSFGFDIYILFQTIKYILKKIEIKPMQN